MEGGHGHRGHQASKGGPTRLFGEEKGGG